MREMSEYFKNKTESEQKLAILLLITECEKLISTTDSVTVVSPSAAISASSLSDMTSSSCIFPKASGELHTEIRQAITRYVEKIKEIEK